MSDLYVRSVRLSIGGEEIGDFNAFTITKRELKTQVQLMNKTGFVGKQPLHTFNLTYVIPQGPRFDFQKVEDAAVTVTREGGSKIIFTGVHTLSIGDEKYGEKEATMEVSFGATGRQDE